MRKEKVLRPVHANVGIEALYRKRLISLVEAMHDSVLWFVRAAYRDNEGRIAQDESPADALRAAIKKLKARWLGRFDDMAKKLAEYFATSIANRSSATLRKILKDGGFAIEFQRTQAMRDIEAATVQANVSLIKSIPQEYLTQVEGIVLRGAQTGRDAGQISTDLIAQFGVSKRRAAFIAQSQCNLATAAFTKARQIEAGITEAVWHHSGGGRKPRPSHIKAGRDKVRYDVRTGWFDPHEQKFIYPGELPRCRCVSRSIVRGIN